MNLKRYLRPCAIVLSVSLLAACSNTSGIFSSIQEESKNTSTSTFYQTAVPDLAAYGNNYYARLVGIYSRPKASSAASGWAYLDVSAFGADYVCRGMAATNTGLYVAISKGRGSTSTPNGIFMFDGNSWDHVYTGTENIQALYSANDQIFAVTMDSTTNSVSTYSLKHLNGSALEATGIASLTTMPTNVVYFGASYWCASDTSLYSGSATAMAATTMTYSITRLATDEFEGSAATMIFLGTTTGYVYRSTDGSNWGSGKAATYSTSYGVVSMAVIPTGSSGAGRALLVGSSYVGYYEANVTSSLGDFSTGASSQIVAAKSNYDSSLGNMPVMSFVYSGKATDGVLFACASAMAVDYTALWSDTWTTSRAWDGWAAE